MHRHLLDRPRSSRTYVVMSFAPRSMAFALCALASAAQAQDGPAIIFPPEAAPVEGDIGQILLGPIFDQPFACSQHWAGQLAYAGDALGSDCMIEGRASDAGGYARPFRTDGAANEDWYGWGAPVFAPVSGLVVGVHENAEVNRPGSFGSPPASMVQLRTDNGVIVLLAHLSGLRVTRGDRVAQGDVLGEVGNNGMSRAPHIHVGAWREADAVPLQLRWDLRATADRIGSN